jgi:hypothetical protein
VGSGARRNRLCRLGCDDDFLAELALGYAYAWKKGALDWE